MKKIITLFVGIIFSVSVFSQAPDWQWARSDGGSYIDGSADIAVDGSGNSYVTGSFLGPSITFGTTTLTNAGSGWSDIYVVKYDTAGNVVWAKGAGGNGADYAFNIAVDSSGNSYVTGRSYSFSITFDTTTLTLVWGDWNIFVVKYDAAGNVVWAKGAGGPYSDAGTGIAVDGSGNIYMTGYFMGSITFGTTTLTNTGYDNIFVVKYDTAGNVAWAESAGAPSGARGNGIAVDGSGNSYVTGFFSGSPITFGTTTLTNAGLFDIFVVKYDTAGNVAWAKGAAGSTYDYGIGIAVDGSGNSYVTGYFDSSPITFGTTTLTNAGNRDIFVVKYDTAGNVIWAKGAGGSNADYSSAIAVDGSGNSYLTGYFMSSSITFGTSTLTNAGDYDIFVVKYDTAGNVVWAKGAGGVNSDAGSGIAVDGSGSSYVTGGFESSPITFGTTTLTNAGQSDIFVARLDTSIIAGITEAETSGSILFSPNPATNEITVQSSKFKVESVEVYDVMGRKQIVLPLNPLKGTSASIDVSKLTAGIYFVAVTDDAGNRMVRKIVKM